MPAPPSPLAIANAIARNAIPLGGILFFGWPAANVLILYFVDTMFAIAVLLAGLMRYFMPPPADDGWAARVNAEIGYVGVALVLVAFFSIPLGVPLIFMLVGTDVSVHALLADTSLRAALGVQAIAAFWSGSGLYRALQTHTPEELRLKRHFALVFLRWLAVLMVTYMGIGFLFGRFAPFFYVVVYTAATVMIEVAPDRFLRAMPGGAEDAVPLPGEDHATPESRRIGGRRHKRNR